MKSRNNWLFFSCVILLFFIIQSPIFYSMAFRDSAFTGNLDEPEYLGDQTDYLNSVLSLRTTDLSKKFKSQQTLYFPNTPSVTDDQFPSGSKFVLALYPFPALKPGYSWIAALLTSFWPQDWFVHKFPRLAFNNLILMLFNSLLLGAILISWGSGYLTAAFVVTLFNLEPTMANANYVWSTHSATGLFCLLSTVFIAIKRPKLSPLWIFLIALILRLGSYSSSHVVPFIIFLGPTFVFISLLQHQGLSRVKIIAAAAVAWILPYAYIRFAEEFSQLGKTRHP